MCLYHSIRFVCSFLLIRLKIPGKCGVVRQKSGIGFVFLFHAHLISFLNSGCEAKDSQKSELNRYTSKEPPGEKTRKEVSVLDVGGKAQRIILRRHVGTENPIYSDPGEIRTGVLEVEGDER